uniref:Uncharacterized protein n=1 Tax=Ananas comosus var. bracteatus TaxID=296719 RepID=A0A6V7Q9E9_ANACO|nr:unnamed protein product [Ananas comosus var. bracteatus]
MGRVRAQKQSLPPRNKVWIRKESVPMTKDSHERSEDIVVHTVRMVGHQEPDQSEEQETLNQMLTRVAARRKAIARQNDPRSSNLQRLPTDSSLPDDPHDEVEEEEQVFMANDPKDAMIASLKRQISEKDRDIINLYKKMDEVMGLLLNVQSNLENQRNQYAPQSDEVRLTVSQSMNTQQLAQTTPSIAPNHPSEKRKASLKRRVRKPAQPEKRDETSPVTIRDFIVKSQEYVESKKKSQETKTDELFWPETCNVISVGSDENDFPNRRRGNDGKHQLAQMQEIMISTFDKINEKLLELKQG